MTLVLYDFEVFKYDWLVFACMDIVTETMGKKEEFYNALETKLKENSL